MLHALLEQALIVALSTFSLNVLVDRVNLRLITDKALLDFVETSVDIRLLRLHLDSVVLHRVVRGLLTQGILVLADHLTHDLNALFLALKLGLQVVDTAELVRQVVLHLVDAILDGAHFSVDTAFQALDLFQIGLSSFDFDGELGSGRLSVIELTLLEIQILLHFVHL